MKIATVENVVYEAITIEDPNFQSSKWRRFSDGTWEELSFSSDCTGHWSFLGESELFEQAYQEYKRPKCSICGTQENIEYVGGYTPYLCDNPDCIPF